VLRKSAKEKEEMAIKMFQLTQTVLPLFYKYYSLLVTKIEHITFI
jgi:hypothetical protein